MSVDDRAAFARLEMQVADLKDDVSKIADTVAVVPALSADVDALKRQTAQIFEQQMKHSDLLLKHAELHTQHTEALMAQREEARQARQSASDLSHELKDAVAAMTRYVDSSQRSTAGEISALAEQVEKLATAQSVVATETCAQTKTLQSIDDNSSKLSTRIVVPVTAVTAALGFLQWLLAHWLK